MLALYLFLIFVDSSEAFHDICGPNKELDEETCQCVCKGGLLPSSCGPHKELDRTSCQCVCKNKLLSTSCGPNKEYDEERCQCVCKKSCPKHQPLNPIKCACECVETPNKCFLRAKRFNHQTCRYMDRILSFVKYRIFMENVLMLCVK